MIKNLVIVLFAFVFIIACGNNKTEKTNDVKEVKTKVEKNEKSVNTSKVELKKDTKKEVVLTVDDFIRNAKEYVGKEIDVTGTAVHVCKESGKKLFLGGKNPKNKVKITAGENMPKFDVKLEGDTLQVKGIVKELRVDEAYLDLQVKQINSAPDSDKDKSEENEKKEHHDAEPKADDHHRKKEDSLKQIKTLREKIKASKEGYISFFSLEFISLKKIDGNDNKAEQKSVNSDK
jgi:hypothetical protein